MAFHDIAKIIKSYINTSNRFGDISIYKKVLTLSGSTEKADKFMLSEKFGGYELHELMKIKERIEYNMKYKKIN